MVEAPAAMAQRQIPQPHQGQDGANLAAKFGASSRSELVTQRDTMSGCLIRCSSRQLFIDNHSYRPYCPLGPLLAHYVRATITQSSILASQIHLGVDSLSPQLPQ